MWDRDNRGEEGRGRKGDGRKKPGGVEVTEEREKNE